MALDFLEIGVPDPAQSLAAGGRGISVDVVQQRLDDIHGDHQRKCAFVGGTKNNVEVYRLDPAFVLSHGLPGWASERHGIGEFPDTVTYLLRNRRLFDKARWLVTLVPRISFATLVREYFYRFAAGPVGHVQLYQRPHDARLWWEMAEEITNVASPFEPPKRITLRINGLVPPEEQDDIIAHFTLQLGYTLEKHDRHAIVLKSK